MRGRRHVIQQAHQPDVAHPPQGHRPLAVLRRLLGIGGSELTVGLGQRSEILVDVFKHLLLVELTRHHQQNVIGLVILLVKSAQAVGGHALDIRSIADRRLPVVVPLVGGRHHALREHALGRSFAALELVAYDGELAREILGLDRAIHHAVGLEPECELEVVVAGRQDLEVVRAVEPGRAVEAGARSLRAAGIFG